MGKPVGSKPKTTTSLDAVWAQWNAPGDPRKPLEKEIWPAVKPHGFNKASRKIIKGD